MDTRTSPEDAGESERPRWIDGPTATTSQPEAQPQMAYLHHTGDGSGTQSTADIDLGNSPCNPCGQETLPSASCTPTASGVIQYDSGWNTGAVSPRERLIVVVREHDDGRLARWIYDMLSGRWAQSQPMDDGTGPGMGGASVPRTPPGPAGAARAAVPSVAEKSGDL